MTVFYRLFRRNSSSCYDNEGTSSIFGEGEVAREVPQAWLGAGPGRKLGSLRPARLGAQDLQEENRELGLGVVASVMPTLGRLGQGNYCRLEPAWVTMG